MIYVDIVYQQDFPTIRMKNPYISLHNLLPKCTQLHNPSACFYCNLLFKRKKVLSTSAALWDNAVAGA